MIKIADQLGDLLRPDAFPHPAREPRLIETHISWVILAGDLAYKLRKPVNFGFLDFSTLEGRRADCEAEVRLNRRLCPDLYLGVVDASTASTTRHCWTSSAPIQDSDGSSADGSVPASWTGKRCSPPTKEHLRVG